MLFLYVILIRLEMIGIVIPLRKSVKKLSLEKQKERQLELQQVYSMSYILEI